MKVRVFTLRWDNGSGRFDDADLRGFLEDENREREVIEVSDHFFVPDRRLNGAACSSVRCAAGSGRAVPGGPVRPPGQVAALSAGNWGIMTAGSRGHGFRAARE